MKRKRNLPRHGKSLLFSILMIASLIVPVIQEEKVNEKYIEIVQCLVHTSTVRHNSYPQIAFPSTLKVSAGVLSSERAGFTRVEAVIPGNLLDEYAWTDQEVEAFLGSLEDEVSRELLAQVSRMPWLSSLNPADLAMYLLLLQHQTMIKALSRRGIAVGLDPPRTTLFVRKWIWTFTFRIETASEPFTSWGIGFGGEAFAWTKLPLRLSSTAPVTIFDIKISKVETFSLHHQTSTSTRTETIVDRRQRQISLIQWLLKGPFSTSNTSMTSRTTVTTILRSTTTTVTQKTNSTTERIDR